jgi:long-chain fatty acid transport protein
VWAWGLAVTVPAGFGTQFELTDPVFGQQNYSSFGALTKILPGIACQVTERLSVGATLGVGVSYANIDGPFYLQTGPLAGAPALIDVQGAGAALIYSLGAQYQLTDRTVIGVSYQSESHFELRGNAHVDLLAPLPLSSAFDSQLNLTWPRTVGIGMMHDLSERHRISTDVIWVNWSKAFDSIGLTLTNASNPIVPGLLGPTVTDQFPFAWRDSVSIRLGYEFFMTPVSVLRAGYVYNSNQVPSGTLTPYVPAILEHGFSVGFGRTWNDFSLDLAYQFAFGPDRVVATSDLAGGDFSNSVFQAQAHWLALALTWQY